MIYNAITSLLYTTKAFGLTVTHSGEKSSTHVHTVEESKRKVKNLIARNISDLLKNPNLNHFDMKGKKIRIKLTLVPVFFELCNKDIEKVLIAN